MRVVESMELGQAIEMTDQPEVMSERRMPHVPSIGEQLAAWPTSVEDTQSTTEIPAENSGKNAEITIVQSAVANHVAAIPADASAVLPSSKTPSTESTSTESTWTTTTTTFHEKSAVAEPRIVNDAPPMTTSAPIAAPPTIIPPQAKLPATSSSSSDAASSLISAAQKGKKMTKSLDSSGSLTLSSSSFPFFQVGFTSDSDEESCVVVVKSCRRK